MIKTFFDNLENVADADVTFAVIAARYEGKWILSRHRERTTWEIPGGHREEGETVEEAARRELFEETGALEYELSPVTLYGVDRDGALSYGKLYFAEVTKLSPIPETSEIGEIELFEILPTELTYPEIQPDLHRSLQWWLNYQSSKDELWDVYDENRTLTGRTHRRGTPLPKGDYHLVVHVWIKNSKGEFLISKRAPTKGYPNMWECTGGSALADDDSLAAALREVKEELGITLSPENGKVVMRLQGKDYFSDIWEFSEDHSLDEIILQESETCGAMFADREKILQMNEDGIFVPYRYLKDAMEIL